MTVGGGRAGSAEVLVVGAGPAGSMTALLLARRGVSVTMIDRAAFPRPKPCGDCLSAAATDLLRRQGLLQRLENRPHAWLEGWAIGSPGGHTATGTFPSTPALAIQREVLDAELVAAAREAGARLIEGRVEGLVRRDSGRVGGVVARTADGQRRELEAGLVVGADGLRSVAARDLGVIRRRLKLRKVSLTAHPALRQDIPSENGPNLGRMHVLDGACIGIAPIGGGRCNLTLVVEDRHAGDLGELGPAAFFDRWLARARGRSVHIPELPLSVGGEGDVEILASGPFDWPTRSPTAAGAALVGDAAGYYDPFTGQGVYQAMAGAEALARAVGPVLEDLRTARSRRHSGDPDRPAGTRLDAALDDYARAHRSLTRPARRVQQLVEFALSRPWLADRALRRLGNAPSAMDALVEVTGDLRHPRALLSPRLVSSFFFPATPEVQ